MKRTLNIAHRGARSLAPENTTAAARKGLEAGADMWELDVRLTADDELIVLHDSTLRRTSDAAQRFPTRRPWNVASFTLAEIQTLDFGSWFNSRDPFGQIQSGAVSPHDQESYIGERAPTLRQALEFTLASDWRANVELKHLSRADKGTLVVERSVALIDRLGMQERVLLSSFDHDYLRQVRRLSSRIRTALLSVSRISRPLPNLKSLGAQAYHPTKHGARARRVAALRSAGFDVNVWTVNDECTMRKLIGVGVSGIITDFPQTLAKLLSTQ